ncbi:septum formation family protein [Leucobacter sp. BZR 635]
MRAEAGHPSAREGTKGHIISANHIRPRATVGAALAGLLLLPALAGCSIFQVTPTFSEESATGSKETQADIADIAVGDCLNATEDSVVFDVPVVPCAESHDEEIFGEFELAGTEYPEAAVIEQESDERCTALFADFVGIDYYDSELDFYTLTPTAEGWNDFGDHTVNCVLIDPAGPVTGSLRGAAR